MNILISASSPTEINQSSVVRSKIFNRSNLDKHFQEFSVSTHSHATTPQMLVAKVFHGNVKQDVTLVEQFLGTRNFDDTLFDIGAECSGYEFIDITLRIRTGPISIIGPGTSVCIFLLQVGGRASLLSLQREFLTDATCEGFPSPCVLVLNITATLFLPLSSLSLIFSLPLYPFVVTVSVHYSSCSRSLLSGLSFPRFTRQAQPRIPPA